MRLSSIVPGSTCPVEFRGTNSTPTVRHQRFSILNELAPQIRRFTRKERCGVLIVVIIYRKRRFFEKLTISSDASYLGFFCSPVQIFRVRHPSANTPHWSCEPWALAITKQQLRKELSMFSFSLRCWISSPSGDVFIYYNCEYVCLSNHANLLCHFSVLSH